MNVNSAAMVCAAVTLEGVQHITSLTVDAGQELLLKERNTNMRMKDYCLRVSANKYGNQKTVVDGIKFDSKKEADRYRKLKLMQRAGIISDLKLQVPFILVPAGHGESAAKYIADFTYMENGIKVVEDVKGYRTKEYVLKRKLFKDKFCSDYVVFREV